MKYFIKHYDTRYFAGIECPNGVNMKDNDPKKIPDLWSEFFGSYLDRVNEKIEPDHYIGLETYPFDFMETGVFDYNAMVETKELIEPLSGMITKKLKAGKYICFPIPFDDIVTEIQRAYKFIKAENIKVHMGFDYEDYLANENYNEPGAILNFCLLLEDDSK